jgi:hypothetical protein
MPVWWREVKGRKKAVGQASITVVIPVEGRKKSRKTLLCGPRLAPVFGLRCSRNKGKYFGHKGQHSTPRAGRYT